MGMGFASTWLRQVSPPPLHKTTLTTGRACINMQSRRKDVQFFPNNRTLKNVSRIDLSHKDMDQTVNGNDQHHCAV